jgi:hypothetical protein
MRRQAEGNYFYFLTVLDKVQGEVRYMAIHQKKPPAVWLTGSLSFLTNILLIVLSAGIYIKIPYLIRCIALVALTVIRDYYFIVWH